VQWRDNPAYRKRPTWQLHGWALWLWRALLAAILARMLIGGTLVGAGIFLALWVLAEVLRLRTEREP
jgi:hypothetical protein